MISREEAKAEWVKDNCMRNDIGDDGIILLNKIYDSIGSCSTCESFTPYSSTEVIFYMLPDGYGSCYVRGHLKPTAFCDEFIRKQDD